jgi:phenylacetic acid degradation operon negative regulatory protein
MVRHRRINDIVSQLLKRLRPKAKSVIITVYGDSVMHHGGSAWLGSVIKLTEPLGLNERVVRTSVFRLAAEDWLVAEQFGRRSYYRLTEAGRRRVDAAHGRIYFHANRPWDHHWTLVITNSSAMKAERREALRRDLRWQGFGQLANGIMLHPDPDEAALRQLLLDSGASKQALVMRTTAEPWVAGEALRDVINRCWDMKRLAADYAAFLDAFRPVWQALNSAGVLDPETCFVVRTLLMHAYRRVLLRDPTLPDELLEANWPGTSARLLCRNLYKLVEGPAERHLMAILETAEGAVPEAHPSYYTRFGGLHAVSAA